MQRIFGNHVEFFVLHSNRPIVGSSPAAQQVIYNTQVHSQLAVAGFEPAQLQLNHHESSEDEVVED